MDRKKWGEHRDFINNISEKDLKESIERDSYKDGGKHIIIAIIVGSLIGGTLLYCIGKKIHKKIKKDASTTMNLLKTPSHTPYKL